MKYVLRFDTEFVYDSTLEGITIDVELSLDPRLQPVRVRAKVDTGASDCLFRRIYADLLGLAVESGERRTFLTAAGSILAYGHEVTIRVLDTECTSTVYFFADDAVRRNLLGRRGWLDRVRLGIVDYESTLYLSAFHEA
jgi:hypothetical protein